MPTEAEDRRVVDLCFSCQLCYPHCPYTPPHRWAVDFPELMLRQRVTRAVAEGIPWRERLLGNPELLGRLRSFVPALPNWADPNRPFRILLERGVGGRPRRPLPRHRRRLSRLFRPPPAP